MFNISFGEVVLVAVVGLLVIGPRRLPETARFVGHLVSRVQRQVAGVKADIRREMDLEDLKSIQREYENTARDIGDDFKKSAREMQNAADSVRDSVNAPDEKNASSARTENTVAQTPKTPTTPWPSHPVADSVAKENDGGKTSGSDSESDSVSEKKCNTEAEDSRAAADSGSEKTSAGR